jgi:hypothetical protein
MVPLLFHKLVQRYIALGDERVFVLGFGLKDDEREAFGVEQQEVDEALARLLEVLAKCFQIG